MYSIRYDERSGIVHLTVSGFWTVEETERFLKDRDAIVLKALGFAKALRVLVDARELSVHSAEVMQSMRKSGGDQSASKVAFMMTTQLAKAQAQRTSAMGSSNVAFFTEITEAQEWLTHAENGDAADSGNARAA